jgi:hypothetical protein
MHVRQLTHLNFYGDVTRVWCRIRGNRMIVDTSRECDAERQAPTKKTV